MEMEKRIVERVVRKCACRYSAYNERSQSHPVARQRVEGEGRVSGEGGKRERKGKGLNITRQVMKKNGRERVRGVLFAACEGHELLNGRRVRPRGSRFGRGNGVIDLLIYPVGGLCGESSTQREGR